MAEVTSSGDHHGQACLVGCRHYLLVAYRPSRLDNRGDPYTYRGVKAVAEREEGVAAAHPAGCPTVGLLDGQADRVTTVLLTGADANSLPVAGQHDGIGGDPGHHPPCEHQVEPFSLGGFPSGDHRPVVHVVVDGVGALNEQTAVDGPHVEETRPGRRRFEDPEVGPGSEGV